MRDSSVEWYLLKNSGYAVMDTFVLDRTCDHWPQGQRGYNGQYEHRQGQSRRAESPVIGPCGFNLLKPTAHVMHQQFNIQQLYALPTLYLCVLYLSENKQRLVSLTA